MTSIKGNRKYQHIMTNTKIKLVIKNTPTKESPNIDDFSGKFYKIFKELKKQENHRSASLMNQFNSVTQSCPTLCNPRNCSMPGFPVYHQPLELIQIHAHWVGDAIQPSPTLLSPSPPAFNLSQYMGLF